MIVTGEMLGVHKVLLEQGLGKFVDADFIRTTSREMQEAMDMTPEEMDRAAHALLVSASLMPDEGDSNATPPIPLSGAATRGGGNQPLTLALSTAFSEVDSVHKPSNKF